MMKTWLYILGLLVAFAGCQETQPPDSAIEEEVIQLPLSFFPTDRAKVLVVGTFHFDYPGMDAHAISEQDKIDVLSEARQAEMTELVEYIKRFQPTKIAIEASDSWEATKKLRNFKGNEAELGRDERYQLGIRLGAELGLDTLYSIDAGNLYLELERSNEAFIDSLTYGSDSVLVDSAIERHFDNWRAYNDEILKDVTLLEYFRYLNSRAYHQLDYGNYLIGYFKLDDKRGADILSIWWYNRNLRIFRKIQEITENQDDRLLVIFGNGHAAVLRQLLESSVEYEYVEFDEL